MPLVHDRCICLRKVEYSETSQILTLFGREFGVFRVIAKGAHRRTKAGASKFDGGIDLMDVGNAVSTLDVQRDLNTLTEWNLREGHPDLRKTFRGLMLAQSAVELIGLLIQEHDPHAELFDRLEQTLLELSSPRVEEAFLAFELDLLHQTGHLPEVSACVRCGAVLNDRAPTGFFSPSQGGTVCRNCEGVTPDRIGIDLRLLRLMQSILKLPRANGSAQRLPRLTRHQTDPINRLLVQHTQHTLGRRLQMTRWVV